MPFQDTDVSRLPRMDRIRAIGHLEANVPQHKFAEKFGVIQITIYSSTVVLSGGNFENNGHHRKIS